MHRLILLGTAALAIGVSGLAQSNPRINAPSPPATPSNQTGSVKHGPASEDGRWVKFTDPNEHAFTVDVPLGWEAVGGTVRRNAIDATSFLRVLSPDLRMMLLFGDTGPAFFHTAGFASRHNDREYVKGKEYAREWGELMLPALCSDVKSTREADRHDLEKGKFAAQGFANHAGEVLFSCTHRGEATTALVVAATFDLPVSCCDRPTIWGVGVLNAWIGPPDHLESGRQMIGHMMLSSQNDPEWDKAQKKRVVEAWSARFEPERTQTSEWEETRKKAEVQKEEINQKFNPQPGAASQP